MDPREISTNSAATLRGAWMRLSQADLQIAFLAELCERDLAAFNSDWDLFAHAYQRPPPAVRNGVPWTTWMLLGGRGAGKTRAGAQWVKGLALGLPGYATAPVGRICLLGETAADVREVMIEGISGILAAHAPHERPQWQSSRRRLEWANGVVAQAFSAEDPESLRGPQFDAAWADEIGKWRQADAAFDMLQFGLRLGPHPRQMLTTTPRPIALVKRLLDDPSTVVTRAATVANARNLSAAFFDRVVARYAGTRLGRQELEGELIEERADALWSRGLIERCRASAAPPLSRVVVAVDPPASAGAKAAACGLVAAGRTEGGHVYVLADETVANLSPSGWAARAIALWRRVSADALVVEVNQGGDMVRAVMREVDPAVPVTPVRATRGKWLRAEPVAALYEQGRVCHLGAFPALEDEMCDFGVEGLSNGRSPDRLDALVWAITALSFADKAEPRVRGL